MSFWVIVQFFRFLHSVQNLAVHFRLKIRPTKYDRAYHVKCPEISYDYLAEIYSRLSGRAWDQSGKDNKSLIKQEKTTKHPYGKHANVSIENVHILGNGRRIQTRTFRKPFYKRTVPSTQYSSFETFLLSRQIWTIKYLTTWLAIHTVLLTLRRWFFKNILFFVILINNTSNWSAGIYQFGFCAIAC